MPINLPQVNVGANPDDGTGQAIRDAHIQHNANWQAVQDRLNGEGFEADGTLAPGYVAPTTPTATAPGQSAADSIANLQSQFNALDRAFVGVGPWDLSGAPAYPTIGRAGGPIQDGDTWTVANIPQGQTVTYGGEQWRNGDQLRAIADLATVDADFVRLDRTEQVLDVEVLAATPAAPESPNSLYFLNYGTTAAPGQFPLPLYSDYILGDYYELTLGAGATVDLTLDAATENLNGEVNGTRRLDSAYTTWIVRRGPNGWIAEPGTFTTGKNSIIADTGSGAALGIVGATWTPSGISVSGGLQVGDHVMVRFGAGDSTGIIVDETDGKALGYRPNTTTFIQVRTVNGALEHHSNDISLGVDRIIVQRFDGFQAGTLLPTDLSVQSVGGTVQAFTTANGNGSASITIPADGIYDLSVNAIEGSAAAGGSVSFGLTVNGTSVAAQTKIVVGGSGFSCNVERIAIALTAGQVVNVTARSFTGGQESLSYTLTAAQRPDKVVTRAEDWDVTNFKDYTTAEQNIGRKWIDGSDIYRQVVTWTGAAGGTHNFATPIVATKVIRHESIGYHIADAYPLPVPISATTGMGTRITNTGVVHTSIGGFNPASGGHTIVEYTK